MSDSNRTEKLKKEGYVETQGPNGTCRIFTPEEYEAFMKKLDARPDQVKADLLRRMLNPVYHEPEKKVSANSGKVYAGSAIIDLIRDFWRTGNGERLIALPSLNSYTPGLFDNFSPILEDDDDPDDPDSVEISQIEMGGKIRILTDVLNHPDWRTLWDFAQYTDIEIRHVQDLNMHLYVHLGRKRAFSIVCPLHCDGSYDDFEDNSIASETSDYKPFQKMFESLWEDAEPITSEKIEHFNRLWSNNRTDDDKEILEHTYFLFPEGKRDDYDLIEERKDKAISRSAFCGDIMHDELSYWSFAYFVGIKIPKDAEQIIICHVDEKTNGIKYDQTFRVFGNNPIHEIDDTLYFYYPERGFSIAQGWEDNLIVVDTYPRPKVYYSKNIYMAMRVYDFDFEEVSRKFKRALNKKFRTDEAFRDALKETCFVRWSDALEDA